MSDHPNPPIIWMAIVLALFPIIEGIYLVESMQLDFRAASIVLAIAWLASMVSAIFYSSLASWAHPCPTCFPERVSFGDSSGN